MTNRELEFLEEKFGTGPTSGHMVIADHPIHGKVLINLTNVTTDRGNPAVLATVFNRDGYHLGAAPIEEATHRVKVWGHEIVFTKPDERIKKGGKPQLPRCPIEGSYMYVTGTGKNITLHKGQDFKKNQL